MPKYMCKCGNIIYANDIPCHDELRFISAEDFESYIGTVDAEEIYLATKPILICRNCSRFLVFLNGYQDKPTFYMKEE